MAGDFQFDLERGRRIGIPEAVYAPSKTPAQLDAAIAELAARGERALLTRLDVDRYDALAPAARRRLDYDPLSRTAILGGSVPLPATASIAVVTAGTGDLPVAAEARRTLAFQGAASDLVTDIGVAGLWRLMAERDRLASFPVVIAIAGMEGALFTVLAGLVGGLVIAVPTSTGYGVATGGDVALRSALASCAPGVVTVNIDNGYGAACAAIRCLGQS